jgi:asparagine synthase (glutamine-hydrolysing)
MCGIAGCVKPGAGPAEDALVTAMLARLVHRGPDDQGLARLGPAVLGVRRLSIIDVEGGHQPVFNEDGSIVVIQNGEIYNYRALREELAGRGHRFRSKGDTEVLPHAYEEWDLAFLDHLRGMFALALWDRTRERLILARDRLGKKPLVYASAGDGLVFASELQALRCAHVSTSVDDDAISEYLAFGYVPAPRTAFAAIRKLRPGHFLLVERGSVAERRYWTPRYEPKLRILRDDAERLFRDKFDEAVRLRLQSDVPIGVLLSGGIDSSAVVESAARQSPTRLKTFSIGFTERDFDELRYARLVADRFGTDHHEFVVDIGAAEVLPQLVRHFGEPFADSSAIPTYWVARTARQHVTVALNGDGGDELFGGYVRYRGVALAAYVDLVPGLAALLAAAGERLPGRLARRRALGRGIRFMRAASRDELERYYRWVGYFTGEWRTRTLAEPWSDRSHVAAVAYAADVTAASDGVERMMAADLLGYLPGDLLPKMDIATMANSLEARSPFLDHELVELVASLPRSYKLSARRSKILLRSALRDALPRETISRGKMGFGVPVGSWLRTELRELLEDALLQRDAYVRRYVRDAAVRELVSEHVSGVADHTPFLWCLLMLELWVREHVEAPVLVAA